MIIVDSALEKRQKEDNPVRVGMIGAGFMGRGIALQILNNVPGMDLVAIANRHLDGARKAYRQAGVNECQVIETTEQIEKAITRRRYAITEDAMIICEAEGVDAIIEVTGAVEFGAQVALKAIEHKKHVILMNAELDGTLGPILKVYADRAGVVLTDADGDQPGVIMNLFRFVKGLGVKPVLCGNIKGLHDPYRNPTTQQGFASKWGQSPHIVTSFADGSKISFEQTLVANATGMQVAQRGMFGPTVQTGTHIREASKQYPLEALVGGSGIVDYVVGAEPSPGVFVLGTQDHPAQKHYLNLYKLGEGPLYCFYTPYHLCHFEVHNTVARAVLFGDATIAPLGAPLVDVVGYYMTYGLCENTDVVCKENLLPIGLAEGCTLKRDIPKDQILTVDDVAFPEGRLCDRLYAEQNEYFSD
jgi:predicted homoserine dehydrogenase-like protein